MSNGVKVILVILVLAYIFSPVDAYPGPIDDVIVALLGVAAMKGPSITQGE